MNIFLARFLIGGAFIGGAVYCFLHDPQYTITGFVLAGLGLLTWGLGEAIGDILD